MYGGQGNYTTQFRQVPPGPPPPYQQVLTGPPPPPFVQPPPCPSLPPAPHGLSMHSLGQQASSYYGQLAAPLSQQPVHFPPPPSVNSSQYSQQLPYPPPPSVNSSQYSQQLQQPPPPSANSSQYSQQLQHPPPPLPPPPPPPPTNVGAPVVPSYPLAGFSVPISIPNSIAHLGMQQPLPPRVLQPTPQYQTQGQVSFHSSYPSHPGMLHAPPAPPWPINVPAPPPAPPPPFDLTIPASFRGQDPARDVHPPSVPSTPPPPPPPPPSSPPPLPPPPPPLAPVTASDGFPIDSMEGFRTNSNIDSEAREHDNAPVHIVYSTRDLREGTMIPVVDEEASENCALPPPRPDEAVVRNMEVLCQFIVKVGPDFENTARAKEAGNPKFDFLFGGEPGSVASIGHEYFQWMKKKYIADSKLSKGLKHNVLPICNLKDEISSQPGNLGRLDLRHSPATSDMDMEDDISPADRGKGFSNTNNESRVSANARSHTANNIKVQLHDEICFASGASSPITSLSDAEDEKESSVFEDVSPNRYSPDTTCPGDGRHAASRLPSRDSINGKVSPINNDAKSQEASGVYLKFGSPFRLIQDYASDESDNENVRSDNEEGSNPVSPRATTTVTSCLQQENQSGSCLNFGSQDLSTDGNGYGYYTSSFQLSALGLQGAVSSPDKSAPLTSNFGAMGENVNPDNHQDENMLNYRSEASRPSSEYDVSDGTKIVTDQEFEMFHSKKSLTAEQNPSHDVDEFGRLVRKGMSGSDSDKSQHDEKSIKRGRSRSKSLSRSPRVSRRRRRSRSPRRRDNRSRSRSLSPKRRRSKSPQLFRSNILARRGRDLPPDCFNFIRGRCFYGASCRFLHRDSGPPNMQQRYQDSRRARYLHSSDSLSFSRSSYHDKTDFTEFHDERCDKLVEADDIINPISFGKLLDGKDKPVQTPEAEDVSNRVLQKMTPEAEDLSILVPQEVIPEIEDACILVSQKMTPAAEDSSNLVSREKISEIENASMLVSKRMTPVPEDSCNLDSHEMTPEVKDGSNPVILEIIRPEHDSPVVEVSFTSVDEEPTQPISDSPKPLYTDNMLVRSPTSKSVSPNHDVFQQPSIDDTVSLKLSESNTLASASEAEKSSEHDSPVQTRTNQSKTVPIQASTSEVDVGEDIVMEETANLNTTTSTYLRNDTSMEPSLLPPNKDIFPPNLLMSGTSLPLPPPPPPQGQHALSLPPPPPPQGQHAIPLPPPPTHGQRLMHISNDSSSSMFSSQQFRENILPPMASYQSQLSPEPFMFYPQRPHLPSNLQSNQLNLPWSDQHMLPLHGRPPFPSSEASQLHHQHNIVPQRNDFIPLSRPYPPNEVASSRQSDFYSQTFLSAPSVHPPRHLSFPVEQGGSHVQNQGLMMPSSSMPLLRSFQGDRVDPRAYPREEFSTPHLRDIGQPLYNQPNPASFGTSGMMHPLIQKYTENNFQSHPSDVSASRFPIREHYNPYASAFEQPRGGDPSIPGSQIRRYDSSLSADNEPIVGFGFGMRPSPMSARRLGEQLPRSGNYVHESSAEMIPDMKKQLVHEPVAGVPYDPLFDSIEPSSGASKMRVEEQNSGVNDTGSASKRRATKVGSKKNRGGVSTELKAEVDEMGEVATDADAGGVENESPQLLDKDWSPLIPFDVGETNVGEVEINQVRSPNKSKKNKDSRSMKLFKVAVADFAKEVLKPSWRQGNLSKEAFKTIVKKTVDKVAGAVPSHQVPKSQAKISQYMDSSQRKLTKLVMGYVDKYIKM